MPPNVLEEAKRFCSALLLFFFSNEWSRRGKLASSNKLYWSAKLSFRLKTSIVTNWNRKLIVRRFSNFVGVCFVSYSFFCYIFNPSDWLGSIKLHIVELILSIFFSFQDNAIGVLFIKKLITEYCIYVTLSHSFGLNLITLTGNMPHLFCIRRRSKSVSEVEK